LARAHRHNSRSISSSRPTSGLNDDPRKASNRTRDAARPQHLPSRHRPGDALHLDGAEIAALEQIADQPARARGNHDSVRLGQRLQPGGEVRRLTDDGLLPRRTLANRIANDYQTGGNPDARLEPYGFDIEATNSVDGAQPRPDCPLGVVLMRFRVAEINQHAVAHVPRDEAMEPGDDFGDGAVIGGDNLAEILRIEPRRERRRADQIAEHHRQLPAFGVGLWCMAECCCYGGGGHCGTERSNRGEQFSAVADRGYADAD
jgi:hypothetical protein